MIRTIWWQDNQVQMIDQRALPGEELTVSCRDYREVIRCIRDLTIRGAPAIGVAAALGIALGMRGLDGADAGETDAEFEKLCIGFAQARPTARNLFWAIERMKTCYMKLGRAPLRERQEVLLAEALAIREEDIANCMLLGRHGQGLISDGANVLTYCNAGALATAGYGTALGVIRAAREAGKTIHVYACETRPVLQGARLTAWELVKEGIAATLITDNMAGWIMSQGKVDCVLVGADRIAANGDVANKVGTYSLAVLAREHHVPFYVAAPLSTLDLQTSCGGEITIEERQPEEVLSLHGKRTAPEGIGVYNPAFDITPWRFVTAIITERGIVRPDYSHTLPALRDR
ncbi:MAG: S-methyl-5-thioribose-1-phosphate isomerase [Smithellaceae bacterium]|nr:S-methyl-5-thioribose-1-phosphate isomerase [Smithellaceae bacterium]